MVTLDAAVVPLPKMTETTNPIQAPTFTYIPLRRSNNIRLITLHRGSADDPVRCTLTNTDFTQEYEALSYEWGPRDEKRVLILLNDILFPIRRNLHDALLHLRRSTCERCLWIDALCINQKNIPEKNLQLRLMGTIYAQSSDALVWLGPAHDESDSAIAHLNKIGLNNHGPKQALLCDERKPYKREMKAILALCNRPYWCRIWIIQEIRLASQVTYCCGYKTIPGETFSLAGKYIKEATNPKMEGVFKQIDNSLASRIIDYSNLEDLNLKKWMIKTFDSRASDQKDKVYALVNLAKDCRGSSELILDCDKKVSLSQVYKDVLKVCSVDKRTGKPVHDVLDLSYVLQRTLNCIQESVQLKDDDTTEIWICGILSAQITSLQPIGETDRSCALRPKNVVTRDQGTAIYTKSSNCVLARGAGQLMRIIRKRRLSDPNAPVELVDGISIASMPHSSSLEKSTATETKLAWRRVRLNDAPHQQSKTFRCSGQDCSGLAPSDTMLGDWVCRFPCSRIGFVFRQVEGRADAMMLVGRAIMDERFQISEKETEEFWMGKPQESTSVSFGCDNAWYLKLDMVTLQRLTAPEVDIPVKFWGPGMRSVHEIRSRNETVRRWDKYYVSAQWLLGSLDYGIGEYGIARLLASATRQKIANLVDLDRNGVTGYFQRLIDPV